MRIMLNVCLILTSATKAKLAKLESLDITTEVIASNNRLNDLDYSVEAVGRQVLEDFSERHGLDRAGLTYTVTVQIWGASR